MVCGYLRDELVYLGPVGLNGRTAPPAMQERPVFKLAFPTHIQAVQVEFVDKGWGAVPSGLNFVSVLLCGYIYRHLQIRSQSSGEKDLEMSPSQYDQARPVLEGIFENRRECIVEFKWSWGDCIVQRVSKDERGLETLNFLSSVWV